MDTVDAWGIVYNSPYNPQPPKVMAVFLKQEHAIATLDAYRETYPNEALFYWIDRTMVFE